MKAEAIIGGARASASTSAKGRFTSPPPDEDHSCSLSVLDAMDQLAKRIDQLDALLTVLSVPGEDGALALFECAAPIQASTLWLLADLAHDIHDMHERAYVEPEVARFRGRAAA